MTDPTRPELVAWLERTAMLLAQTSDQHGLSEHASRGARYLMAAARMLAEDERKASR